MIRTPATLPDMGGLTATEAILEYRFIEAVTSTTAKTATATAGKRIVGVSPRGFASDEPLALHPMGQVVKLTAGTTLTRTTDSHWTLTTDSTGRAVPWTASTGLPKLARWLPHSVSVSANDIIYVELAEPALPPFDKIVGTATIALGASTVDVALPAAVDGALDVTVNPLRADATLGQVFHAWPSGDGTLRITGAANATAATTIRYIVRA